MRNKDSSTPSLPHSFTPSTSLRLLVLGNGIAGATAARVARTVQPAADVVLVSGEHPLLYSRTALMYVFMGHLRAADTHLYDAAFWEKNRIRRVMGTADALDLAARTLRLASGETLGFDRLVVATGSTPRRLTLDGTDAEGVVQLYGLPDLARIEAALPGAGGRAVVIGGGLTGVELCEMLLSRGLAVTFLVREARLMGRTLSPDESALAEAELRCHGVDLRLGASVAALETSGGRVTGATLATGETVAAGLVAVAVGVEPNVALARAAGLAVGRGVRVSPTLETSAQGVFAAGDCAEHAGGSVGGSVGGGGRVDQLWYTARAMGAVAGYGLAGAPRPYAPGVPFNAAKFFGREWQTTGFAPGTLPGGYAETTWRDDRAGQAFRLVVDGEGRVAGVSAFGMRLRQAVCMDWVARRASLGDVLATLRAARFDGEFTRRRAADIALALTLDLALNPP